MTGVKIHWGQLLRFVALAAAFLALVAWLLILVIA